MVGLTDIVDKGEWERGVGRFPEANFLHSWNWGEFHLRLGQRVFRRGFNRAGRLVGMMLVIVERAKRATYLTVPGGPLVDWTDAALTTGLVAELGRLAKSTGASFARVRPQLINNDPNKHSFTRLGFRPAPMHLHAELTRVLDLRKSEAELLAGMRKATRYEIKRSLKLGIRVTASQKVEDIDPFYSLQVATSKRQGFVPFSRRFLKEQFAAFVADDQAVLYTAWLGRKKLAQAVVIYYGQEADYHYGASAAEGRKYPGAYLVQWTAIQEAKRRKIARYNLWGVAPEGASRHRFYGVSVFKRGFGGEDVDYLHAQDLVFDWPRYALDWGVEIVRKWTRRV